MNPQILPDSIINFYPDDYSPHQQKHFLTEELFNIPFLKRILGRLNSDSQVLDVGCGNGAFLYSLRQKTNCQVFGIELSEKAVESAKVCYGLNVFCGTVEGYQAEENAFDLITAWSVLEHVPDPMGFLQIVSRMVKPGGWFCIKTPNVRSLNACLFRDKWYALDSPRHLFLFSPRTIRCYFQQNGLDVQSILYDGSSKTTLCSLQYVFYGNNTNPITKDRIRRSALAKTILSPLTHFCGCLRLADQMFVFGRKGPLE
ncbi:MAG TPA: class I SAM-dependent methyltransferase [Anaerohalosphaeraceae bacterium]|nr:class I SAM-dependent methyltransferase [Anaerohalosphaeraceae bacterium]